MYSLLNREEKQKLKIIKTHKDQLIFREDEDCEYAGIVVSGQISIRSYNLNGKEVIYNTIDSGGIFGNNLLFSSDRKYKGDSRRAASVHGRDAPPSDPPLRGPRV